jgi:hypothetical protein
MTTLAPLAAPEADPWLGRFAGPTRTWWLLRDDDPEQLGNAVADVVRRAGDTPRGAWVLEARGTSSGTRYVVALPTMSVAVDGQSRALVGPVGPDEVIDALDRAETAGVSMLLLLMADREEGPAMVGSLWDAAVRGAATDPPLVMTIDAGHRWAAIGALSDAPPPVSQVQVLPDTVPWPGLQPSSAGRGGAANRQRRRAAVVVTWIVAACLVTASTWLALRGAGTGSSRQSSGAGSLGPAATLPDPRYEPSIAFDPGNGTILLFGGGERDTTWLWAGQDWRPATPRASPSDRYGSAMAYDPALRKMLLFGGREIPGGVPNDTWAWDGRSWSRLAASGPGPPGYEFSAMAWDAARGQMVLVTPPSGPVAGPVATWTWSGHGWTRRPSPRAPPAAASTLAFDSATRTVLLVAESPLVSSASATWSWDGTTWQELHPLHAPTLLGPAFMAAVPGARQLMLVTASDNAGGIPQTWTWDGRDWTEHQPQLLASNIAGLAGDDASGAVIAFGAGSVGPLSAAWAWTGTEWVSLATTVPDAPPALASLHPSPRQFASTTYDPLAHQLVLFGGTEDRQVSDTAPPLTYDADTWIFKDERWSRSPTTTHPPSTGVMSFDPVTGTVIIVADANGSGFLGPGLARPVTWKWDGTSWRQAHPASELPLGTIPVAMVSDPATRTVVAVANCCQNSSGGYQAPPTLSTWVWNGQRWLKPHSPVQPGSGLISLAYESGARRVLATVSDGTRGRSSRTWAWDGTWTELQPARNAILDPLTAVMADDPSSGAVVLLETTFQAAVSGDETGGTLLWNGATWTDHDSLALPSADTAYGDAALYEDADIGRLVVLSSTDHDFSRMWMWTGAAWVELATR